MKEETKEVNSNGWITFGAIVVLLLLSIYIIPAGHRGVLLTLGKPSLDSKGEGIHMKVPIIQNVKKYEVRTQKYEADASAASKDLQTVTTKMAVNYHLTPENVPILYRDVGLSYANRIIQPLEQEIVKATTAKYTAEELITRREVVRMEIKDELHKRLLDRGIVVEEVSIVNFDFSASFNAAIEAKVTAEQSALAAKNKLEQVKYEAEQKIAEAEGKAQAMSIESKALRENPDILELRAIEKWDGKLPAVTGGAVPFVDIKNFQSQA